MQSVIIVGSTEKSKEKLLEIAKENKVSEFDVEILESEKAIGIPDIRILQKKIFLTPVKGDKKIIAINASFGATVEAQNSLLKVLEEPPASTIMIILCKTLDFLLPTIISRCNVIKISEKKKMEDLDLEKSLTILKQIQKDRVGKGFLYAQNYGKTKEEALVFLENLIITLHEQIETSEKIFSQKEINKMLKNMQKFHTTIKTTNINVRFALENLFLDF